MNLSHDDVALYYKLMWFNSFANAVIPAKAGIHLYADDCQSGECTFTK